MEDVSDYFENLNKDIVNSKTRRTLKVLTRRAKRIYKRLHNNAMSNFMKYQVKRQYQNSLNLISEMYKKVRI